jgi:hypothetical protein
MLGFVAIVVPLIIHVDTFGMSLLYSNELRKVNIGKCSRGIRVAWRCIRVGIGTGSGGDSLGRPATAVQKVRTSPALDLDGPAASDQSVHHEPLRATMDEIRLKAWRAHAKEDQ